MDKTNWREKLRELLLLKFKFGLSGLVATAINYGLYLLLVNRFFSPVPANIIAYSTAVIVNFVLQKRFVFSAKGKGSVLFFRAMLVSVVGLGIDTGIIYGLNQMPFFAEHQAITKLISTGIVFFYNFYFKRYAFERKFI
ncbi:MAG TPA: GtrA family protein [Saprospiraceae bacterium]|nr:GtrA family protein [Saprospiraceae bacterium]